MKRVTASCDCGWAGGPYRSPAQAEHALSQHSCARQRRKDRARVARVRRRATVDRTPKPCLHKIAHHEHGTHAAYVLDRCRCRPCSKANSAYERNRQRQQAYGRWNGYVDAGPARAHVQSLLDQGMGLKRIIAVGGTNSGQLWKLLYGKPRPDGSRVPSKRIRPEVAERLLAVKLDLAAGARVDSAGARRRIQALACLGWSAGQVAVQAGLDRQVVDGILHGRHATLKNAKRIAETYDRLWNTPAPADDHRSRISASRTRRRAEAAGWAPPLAWDDDTIDNPDAAPQPVSAPSNGRGRRAEDVIEDIEWLLEDQPLATAQQLGHRLGVTRDAIQHACRRAGRDDLTATLARNAALAREGSAA